jgi:hypothetical protein
MRIGLVFVTLWLAAGSAAADENTDELVLEAARKAGYANPEILARGDIFVVAERAPKTADDILGDTIGDERAAAIGRYGKPVVELGKLAGPLTAVAAKPFLSSKTLVQLDVGYRIPAHTPNGYAAPHRFVVRNDTLEKACDFGLSYDSGSANKGSRTTNKVTVTKVKAKPLTFTVRTSFDRHTFGGGHDRKNVTIKYELGDTGVCVDVAKKSKK